MAEEATAQATETPAAEPTAPEATNDNAVPNTAETGKPANDNTGKEAKPPTDREVLEALAKKLNFAIDGEVVTVPERAAFREERRKSKSSFETWKNQQLAELKKEVEESQAEIELGRAIRSAYETGNPDGIAQALKLKDWNELQDGFLKRLQDPNHLVIQELKGRLDKKEQEEQAESERRAAEENNTKKQRAIQQWKEENIAPPMRASKDKILNALHDHPDVVQMIFAIQNEHWDGSRTISVEDALHRPLPGGRVALREYLRDLHERLSKAFTEEKPAPEPKKAAGKTEPKPGVAPSKSRTMDDDDWTRRATKQMEESFREEDRRAAEEKQRINSHRSA